MQEQDWSTPLDISLLPSSGQYLVWFASVDDVEMFAAMSHESWSLSDGERKLMVGRVRAGYDCFRFSRTSDGLGHLAGYDHKHNYDQCPDYSWLPRFTFYVSAPSLSDIDVSGSATLL